MDRPACRRLSSGLLTKVRPAVGRLLGADIRRYTLLFALSAALLAESTSLAIGSNSMQLLGTEQIAAERADRLPAALLISTQSVLDQRDGRLSDHTFQLVTDTAGGSNPIGVDVSHGLTTGVIVAHARCNDLRSRPLQSRWVLRSRT